MSRQLTPKEQVDIVNSFTVNLETVISIADRYDRTRQSVYKVLWKHGIDPSKHGVLTVSCAACGEPMERHRARVRRCKHLFCDMECYYAFVEGRQQGAYKPSRQGQRIARVVVSNYFNLQSGHIVHHIDRNQSNNHPKNLMVFANQGDHTRYHRLGPDYQEPIWDGSQD